MVNVFLFFIDFFFIFLIFKIYSLRYRSLSDADQDGSLNCEEFIIAMYLVQSKLNGEELPEVLPDTIAPSKRSNSIIQK